MLSGDIELVKTASKARGHNSPKKL